MNNSKIWLISDTHFSHYNIIKYCHRPYNDCREMNEDIISKWNNTVSKNDIVWHLGDFAFFKKKDADLIKTTIVDRLNGNINLVLGNHDKRVSHDLLFWYNLGFKKVWDEPFVFLNNYIFSHEPIISKNGIDLKYHPKLKNIHGHTHNSNANYYAMSPEEQKRWSDENPNFKIIPDITSYSFNVSIEVIDYKPILLDTVIDKLNFSKR